MPGFFESAVLLVAAALLARWFLLKVVLPSRELLRTLRRVASGDYRAVILGSLPRWLRPAGDQLRRIAETLSRQEQLLEREEYGLATILGSMTEGVVIVTPDLHVRLVNRAAEEMFGLRGSVKGMLMAEAFISHELQGVARRAALHGGVERVETTIPATGRIDRRHLLVTAAPLGKEGAATGGLLLVMHDITRLRELEAVRREFVANVSHEFRTPLSVISGYLETLEDDDVEEETRQTAVSAMRRHALRLNRLIEDLLTISRMEERHVRLEKSRVDLPALLRTVTEQLETEILRRGASVTAGFPAGFPEVYADAHCLEQAFSNLLANALRHGAEEGGKITVSAATDGREVSVSIADNGPGIPLKDQDHLFERFYRVGGDRARQTGGTGLGLSIVKHVISAHGGRVTLRSMPGEGATFTVHLPLGAGAGI